MELFKGEAFVDKLLGTITIDATNFIWKTPNNSMIVIPRMQIIGMAKLNTATEYKLKIKLKERSETFTFRGAESKTIRDRIVNILSNQEAGPTQMQPITPSPNASTIPNNAPILVPNIDLDEENIEKIEILSKNKHLQDLHHSLVMGKILTENDFWKYASIFTENEVKKTEEQQKEGLPNKLQVKAIPTEESIQIEIDNKQVLCHILNLYPTVRKNYFENVPHHISAEEFWKNFLSEQYENSTDLVGGTKPVEPPSARNLPEKVNIGKGAGLSKALMNDDMEIDLGDKADQIIKCLNRNSAALVKEISSNSNQYEEYKENRAEEPMNTDKMEKKCVRAESHKSMESINVCKSITLNINTPLSAFFIGEESSKDSTSKYTKSVKQSRQENIVIDIKSKFTDKELYNNLVQLQLSVIQTLKYFYEILLNSHSTSTDSKLFKIEDILKVFQSDGAVKC